MATASLPPANEALDSFTRWRNARARARVRFFRFIQSILQNIRVRILRWRIAQAIRDPAAKCPACGTKTTHRIKWIPTLKWRDGKIGGILHQCAVCTAPWAEKPIVDFDSWKLATTEAEHKAFLEMMKANG